jgi:hypothetical protein
MDFGWANPFGDDFLGSGAGINRAQEAERRYGGVDPRGDIRRTADHANRMAEVSRGRFQNTAALAAAEREAAANRSLLGQQARGENSISAEQLRQGLQANQATQMSMAAGASPANSAMAARNASANAAMVGGGLAGQQAMAGIQERNQAQMALQAALGQSQQAALQQRQQEMQAALGGQQNALAGYGNIEDNRTRRYGSLMQTPTAGEQALSGAVDVGKMVIGAFSDRRLKKDIAPADDDAEEFLKGLKAYRYRYKDERDGKGEFVGPMAQDLERSRAGRAAVVETPHGKAVHGARLGLALAAAAGNLHKRLAKLEGKDE